MSHELRTPLNAIIGFTEIICQELFGPVGNEKYLEYVKDVHSSSLHLLSIINDVLDMSKIEAGKLELAKAPVTLQEVLGDVIRIVHERAGCRGIELVCRWIDQPIVIWADERAVKQIFLNLLSNAIKFSEDSKPIFVRVSAEKAAALVVVEDRGIGMNEEEQERALLPFGQAKPATTGNYGGTGLGLPITKGLVEAPAGLVAQESTRRGNAGAGAAADACAGLAGPPHGGRRHRNRSGNLTAQTGGTFAALRRSLRKRWPRRECGSPLGGRSEPHKCPRRGRC